MHEPDQWFKARMYWSNIGKEDEPNYKKVGLETRSSPLCWLFRAYGGYSFRYPDTSGVNGAQEDAPLAAEEVPAMHH